MNDIRTSDAIVERKLCVDCGEMFSITGRQLAWLSARNLQPFRRCETCRAERRRERGEQPAGAIPRLTTRPVR
jgi:hypothetical protein